MKIQPNQSSKYDALNQKQSLPEFVRPNQQHCIRILVDEKMHNENRVEDMNPTQLRRHWICHAVDR